MLYRNAMLMPVAAMVMAIGMAAPSTAQDEDGCDTEKLAAVVKDSGVSGDGPGAAVEVVAHYAPNACAVGRQSVAMVRGMMSDAYGAADSDEDRQAALMAAKALADNAGMGCTDKDAAALLVLDACSLDDVQAALKGAM